MMVRGYGKSDGGQFYQGLVDHLGIGCSERRCRLASLLIAFRKERTDAGDMGGDHLVQ